MDIRNIQIPNELQDREPSLELIYELGKDQLDNGYKQIEKLPDYPLNINIAKSQVILKDFIGRVIEELSEGFESTEEVYSIVNEYGFNMNLISHEDYRVVLNHLQNANEEQADAIGFFITLLLYSNILPEDILEYVSIHTSQSATLDTVMSYGVKLMVESIGSIQSTGYTIFDSSLYDEHKTDKSPDFKVVESYTPGFHHMSEVTHTTYEQIYLWQVTHQLNITRNLLKNRPWKQTQVLSKEDEYQESLVKSFIMYLGFLALNDFTSKSLVELFIRKQQLNKWRISTGY